MYVWNALVVAAAVIVIICVPVLLVIIFIAYPYTLPFIAAVIVVFTILWKATKQRKEPTRH